MVSFLPCLLGFALGWVLWDRWLAQAATIVVWALFLLPGAVFASLTGIAVRSPGFWLTFLGLFALSLVLVEAGLRLRDRYQRYLRRRFPRRFANAR